MIELKRETKETNIDIVLEITGSSQVQVSTGIGFFDHMLTSLSFWAGWNLKFSCIGDLEVDSHHTIEDTGLALGKAFYKEWREIKSIERIAHAFCPLDEALTRVVVDICNRPYSTFSATFNVEKVGAFDTSMTGHFFRSFSQESRINLHIHNWYGDNAHHIIETIFKGVGLALRKAVLPRHGFLMSTKGAL